MLVTLIGVSVIMIIAYVFCLVTPCRPLLGGSEGLLTMPRSRPSRSMDGVGFPAFQQYFSWSTRTLTLTWGRDGFLFRGLTPSLGPHFR